MARSLRPLVVLCLGLAAVLPPVVQAQDLDWLDASIKPAVVLPLGPSTALYREAFSAELRMGLALPLVRPWIGASWNLVPSLAQSNLAITRVLAGTDLHFQLTDRLGLSLGAGAGLYQATWKELSSSNWTWEGNGALSFRIVPAASVYLGAGYQSHEMGAQALHAGLNLGLGMRLSLSGLRNQARLDMVPGTTTALFPVLYSQYDRNSFGSITIRNTEDGAISNLRVSFYSRQYMERPRAMLTIPLLEKDRETSVALYALFTQELLKLTESTRILGEIKLEYEYLGQVKTMDYPLELEVHNRNAMTWDDDRKAAAFISSKDPAVLRYSKYVSGLVRDSMNSSIDMNFQLALGLFENLRHLSINYVVDPVTPYIQFSENATAIDYLQFPFQTIAYRGGDCDDLSILYTAVLESVGIESALITIPGHIFTAFRTDMSPAEASAFFPSAADYLVRDGAVWIPVEATAIQDGFFKAWQKGMSQVMGASQDYRLISVHEAWTSYSPVGVVDEDGRMPLPQPGQVRETNDAGFAEAVVHLLGSRVRQIKADPLYAKNDPVLANRLGILYARFGKYTEARAEFDKAVRSGSLPAQANLANLAMVQGDYKQARVLWDRLLQTQPDHVIALQGLARTWFELKDPAQVNKTLDRLAMVNPELARELQDLRSSGPALPSGTIPGAKP